MQCEFYFEFRIQLASAIASCGTVSTHVSESLIQWVTWNLIQIFSPSGLEAKESGWLKIRSQAVRKKYTLLFVMENGIR